MLNYYGGGYDDYYVEGSIQFKSGDYRKSLTLVRKARQLDEDSLVAWFLEIRILRLLEKKAEERELIRSLLKKRPELRALPMFQGMDLAK